MADLPRLISAPIKVLLLEDEITCGTVVRNVLAAQGFEVRWIQHGTELLSTAEHYKPAMVVVDNVPGQSCTESCRELRANPHTASLPIIVYSSTAEENDIQKCLEQGADDYVLKSYSPSLLGTKIILLCRRFRRVRPHNGPNYLKIGDLQIDVFQSIVYSSSGQIALSPSELEILMLLALRSGKCVSRAELIATLPSRGSAKSSRVIDVFIVRLRKKLLATTVLIEAVRRQGYRLITRV
ncbi:MAG: response regulator transcription factor [Oligoflexia bacterium]|nr:response regulator transcription factor [Oligoflexia bacterium]